jgi:hypothetical protein
MIVLGLTLGLLTGVGCVKATMWGGLIAERVALHNQFDHYDFGFGLIRALFTLSIAGAVGLLLLVITPRSVFRLTIIVTGCVCAAHVLLITWWGTPTDMLVHTPAFESFIAAATLGAVLFAWPHRHGGA